MKVQILATLMTALLASIGLAAVAAGADTADTVYLPCRPFTEGGVWRYKTAGDWFDTVTEETVLSADGHTIVIGEKTTTSAAGPAGANVGATHTSVSWSLSTMKYAGNTAYTLDSTDKDSGYRTSYRHAIGLPECGDLPRSVAYEEITTGGGETLSERKTLVTEPVGRERITVPAGTFDVVVVKQTTTGSGIRLGPNALEPSSTLTGLIYAAEGVGVVRRVTTVDTWMPELGRRAESGSAAERKRQALSQQILQALQRGEDVEAALAELAKLDQGLGQVPGAAPGMASRRMSMSTELTLHSAK